METGPAIECYNIIIYKHITRILKSSKNPSVPTTSKAFKKFH